MPRLFVKETNALLGDISSEDLQVLADRLEEEGATDTDYFIDAATIEFLESQGAAKSLLALLTQAVGDGDGLDVRWEE